MAKLAISLLGSFEVTLDGSSYSGFATDKVRALLAYLVVEANRPHRRLSLAALLWPDRPEAMARNDLRQALFQLRKSLRKCPEGGEFLLLSAEEVQVNPVCDRWLDVTEFNEHISACRAHHPDGLSLCDTCSEHLQRAVALYRGEFLSGFSLPGCHNFDLWQVWTQETCHIRALEALTHLSNYYESQQCYDQVLEYTRRKIELEPWRESAYRRRMRALALSGQAGLALQQFEACREILRREFGIAPSPETVHLYEEIQNGRLVASVEPVAPVSHNHFPDRALSDLSADISNLDGLASNQSLQDLLGALAQEIQKLHAGQTISAGRLQRLREALRDLIASLGNSALQLLLLAGLPFLDDIFNLPVEIL